MFSHENGRCVAFRYKGTGGNDNRFNTKNGCEAFCLGEKKSCSKSNKKKHRKPHKHHFYDIATLRGFGYGGFGHGYGGFGHGYGGGHGGIGHGYGGSHGGIRHGYG